MDKDAVTGVEPDRPRQDQPFKIAALPDQVLDSVLVRDPCNILLDDRTLVEIPGDIMTGGADDLDPPLIRLSVRTLANKGRQEGMVDVNDIVGIFTDHRRREDLHVPGQDDEVNAVFPEQCQLFRLLPGLVFGGDGKHMERDAVPLANGCQL